MTTSACAYKKSNGWVLWVGHPSDPAKPSNVALASGIMDGAFLVDYKKHSFCAWSSSSESPEARMLDVKIVNPCGKSGLYGQVPANSATALTELLNGVAADEVAGGVFGLVVSSEKDGVLWSCKLMAANRHVVETHMRQAMKWPTPLVMMQDERETTLKTTYSADRSVKTYLVDMGTRKLTLFNYIVGEEIPAHAMIDMEAHCGYERIVSTTPVDHHAAQYEDGLVTHDILVSPKMLERFEKKPLAISFMGSLAHEYVLDRDAFFRMCPGSWTCTVRPMCRHTFHTIKLCIVDEKVVQRQQALELNSDAMPVIRVGGAGAAKKRKYDLLHNSVPNKGVIFDLSRLNSAQKKVDVLIHAPTQAYRDQWKHFNANKVYKFVTAVKSKTTQAVQLSVDVDKIIQHGGYHLVIHIPTSPDMKALPKWVEVAASS